MISIHLHLYNTLPLKSGWMWRILPSVQETSEVAMRHISNRKCGQAHSIKMDFWTIFRAINWCLSQKTSKNTDFGDASWEPKKKRRHRVPRQSQFRIAESTPILPWDPQRRGFISWKIMDPNLKGGYPKWLVYNGKSYWLEWFRGTPII